MEKERLYSNAVGQEHLKKFGQYFTAVEIADFMTKWACQNAKTMLDPAVGNSVFFRSARTVNQTCRLTGYEVDEQILNYFGNPACAEIVHEDYLKSNWDMRYDAIVCNPPYNRFQAIANRASIIDDIFRHTGIKCSGYTNLYILFLIKSIYQLAPTGRLAYIIPSEFLNSQYGTTVKELLIEKNLLTAVINFENDSNIFFNATTTCCILLLDHSPKESVSFCNLNSPKDLASLASGSPNVHIHQVPFADLTPSDKWRPYFEHEAAIESCNLRDVNDFCYARRGIATGANDFFCLNQSKMRQNNIPLRCVSRCISRSADIVEPVFTNDDLETLISKDKTVFVLDAIEKDAQILADYISYGIARGVHKKYLPASRTPWYSMEQKKIAPIWISSACRGTIKVVRNLANAHALTTFHSLFIVDAYKDYTDIIFCYFLTPVAQKLLRDNRKELGNSLDKFQPNDINHAKMLDLTLLSSEEKGRVLDIYQQIKSGYEPSLIDQLNDIFTKYI